MTIRRPLAAGAAATLLTASLAGCGLLPTLTGASDSRAAGEVLPDLVDTTWSGVDSDGDSWRFVFQGDGSLLLTYNGSDYDDPADTWGVEGDDTLNVHVNFTDGDVDLTGPFDGVGSPVDLDGTYPGGTFTVTLVQD